MSETLLKARGLVKKFPVKKNFFGGGDFVHAVDGVDIDIPKEETLGLVGESGCGKSTLGKLILRLVKPDSGQVVFDGTDIMSLDREQMRLFRKRMQIIFQDPYSSLNPRMTVGEMIGEPFLIHKMLDKKDRDDRVRELLSVVGLKDSDAVKYPHEFSGGQRQRVGIARAIALNPEFIVADEAVSALDVSIQSEIINLLMDLQDKFGISFLFISHDLKVVVQMSRRIGVMYLGQIVEKFDGSRLFEARHPYTQALISAVPLVGKDGKRRQILRGDIPSQIFPPEGCRFHPRCLYAKDICKKQAPLLRRIDGEHFASCHFAEEISPLTAPVGGSNE